MSKWKLSLCLLMLLPKISVAEVTLRVLLQPPMVTLECLIINAKDKTSVIMMCPGDSMCFQNCERICDQDCLTNPITCSASRFNLGLKYTYVFSTSNQRNQGEWTCHFGAHQSSTVVFVNETDRKIASTSTKVTVVPTVRYSSRSPFRYRRPLIKENTVIILLTLFILSLCINIGLIIRCVLCQLSTRKSSITSNSRKKMSCIKKLCIRLFCVENHFIANQRRLKCMYHEDGELLTRQISNNIYECGPSSHLQPAIVLDNYAFIGSPYNQRLIYARSQSFPTKLLDNKHDDICLPYWTSPTIRRPPLQQQQQHTPLLTPRDSASQIIYDDVAEQSISYKPSTSSPHLTSLINRPSQYINIHRGSPMAMSLNNLANNGYRLPEVSATDEDSYDESTLKDAISSRVELSKEMINHADTLLKRADSLLNDKEHQTVNGT